MEDHANKVERNELANTTFSSYSSVDGQIEKFPSTDIMIAEEIEEEAGLLGENDSHKHRNTAMRRKEKASELKDLQIDIKKLIKAARPPLSSKYCCIYKVSPLLREVNENAYTPRVVSVGPLHHNNENLKGMQGVKIRYLKQFFLRATNPAMFENFHLHPHHWEHQKAWEDVNTEKLNDFSDKFLKILKSSEKKIRKSYSEDLDHFTSEDLLMIILVDAAFIIELFLRIHSPIEGDIILSSPMLIYIRTDLGLLENQVPFFVLKDLYDAAFRSYNIYPTFLDISRKFFIVYDYQKEQPIEREILHFTDLLRAFVLPIPKAEEESRNAGAPYYSDSISKIFTDFLQYWGFLSRPVRKHEDQEEAYFEFKHLKSATQLHAAGVVFTVSSSKCLLDIKYSTPKLEIPFLHLARETEVVFRNLMALEQYHYRTEALICDYITLMDYLINTGEDVELLAEMKIIKNWLGSNDEAASLFNRLRTNILKGPIDKRFFCLIEDLNAYCAKPWNSWKATLWSQYFSTPWRCASTIAAIILLVLTLAQTILAVVSL